MSWLKSLNPFRKKEDVPAEAPTAPPAPPPGAPELPKDLADSPEAKGLMSFFYRKWKDPAFIKQMKAVAAHMAKDGVDMRNKDQVKAWLEKNKEGLESGAFKEPPAGAPAQGTYVKTEPEIGRNEPCPCGSRKKFKKCCALKKA